MGLVDGLKDSSSLFRHEIAYVLGQVIIIFLTNNQTNKECRLIYVDLI